MFIVVALYEDEADDTTTCLTYGPFASFDEAEAFEEGLLLTAKATYITEPTLSSL